MALGSAIRRFFSGTGNCAAKKPDLEVRAESSEDVQRLQAVHAAHGTLKLHFGCGPRVLKGWINIDLRFVPYAEYLKYYTDKHYPDHVRGDRSDMYVLDITKSPIPLPDNSVDLIFHEDFIEHLSQKNQIILLAECLRVLKPGAVHRVNTPDLIASMEHNSDMKAGWGGVYSKEWDAHGHINVLTPLSLKEMASMVGYSKVIFSARNCSTSKEIPLEYRPDPNDRDETGNIFADLIK